MMLSLPGLVILIALLARSSAISCGNVNANGHLDIPSGTTNIATNTFQNCQELKTMTIPSSVKTIGKSAFQGCTALKSATIPEGTQSVGEKAFYGCGSMTDLSISKTVTTIGPSAFMECNKLTNLYMDTPIVKSSRYFSSSSFSAAALSGIKTLEVGANVDTIGVAAFYKLTGLSSLTLPDGLLEIKSSAFYLCSALASVSIPATVTTIGNYAFYRSGVVTVTKLKSSVDVAVSIGPGAFYECIKLESLIIGSVQSIGNNAFDKTPNIKKLYIRTRMLGTVRNFVKTYLSYSTTSIKEADIGGSSKIENYAMTGCTSLETLIIGDDVSYIGSRAFNNCVSLNHVSFGNSQNLVVGTNAFDNAKKISDISFGTSKSIEFKTVELAFVTSLNVTLNFNKIMNTILREANDGAFTTKGQAMDRRRELIEIDRAGEAGFAEATGRCEAIVRWTGCNSRAYGSGGVFRRGCGEPRMPGHPLDRST